MRRLLVVCSAGCLAAGLAWSFSFLGASAAQTGSEQQSSRETISQGSIATHPYVDVSEGPSPGYWQVVDNATPGRFEAPGWGERSGDAQSSFGGGHAYSQPSEEAAPARFKVEIPATGSYSLYAWWPARASNSAAARFGVSTTSGVKWTEVDQQRDGGMWVKLGAYEMEAGDSYAVQISGSSEAEGEVVADAVVVLSGEQANPEEAAGDEIAAEKSVRAARGRATGREVVRMARRHLGTRYTKSPPHRCRAYRQEDCSCHTKVVFRRFGKTLRDNPPSQWKRGKRVKKANLHPGDLVFFDENRNGKLQPWDHVGIYSGHGNLIHASSYFDEVVESKMKWIDGYWGAKRIKRLR
jgi:cell wall-associated NlpC family hydrolase